MIAINPIRVEGRDGVDRAEVHPDRLVLTGPGGTFVISFRDAWRRKTPWLPRVVATVLRRQKIVGTRDWFAQEPNIQIDSEPEVTLFFARGEDGRVHQDFVRTKAEMAVGGWVTWDAG